jgi:hypothetical protein
MEEIHVPKEGDVKILFSCTTIDNESTFLIDYDQIHQKFIDFFDENWNDKNKMVKFIFQGISDDKENRYGIQQMENDNYVFVSPIEDVYLVDYLEESDGKYDIVFLAQCSNLIDTFYSIQELPSLYSPNIDVLNQNIEILYDHIKTNGFLMILSCGEEESRFVDFSQYRNSDVFQSMDVYIYLIKVMNQLFEKLDSGIYQKKQVMDLKSVFDECFEQTTDELFEISNDNDESFEEGTGKSTGKGIGEGTGRSTGKELEELEEETTDEEDTTTEEDTSTEEEDVKPDLVSKINDKYFDGELKLNSVDTKHIKKNIFHLLDQIMEDRE